MLPTDIFFVGTKLYQVAQKKSKKADNIVQKGENAGFLLCDLTNKNKNDIIDCNRLKASRTVKNKH